MADTWTDGAANWNTPTDWSAGLPDASSDVVISQGNPEVTASFGTVASILIEHSDDPFLSFTDAGTSSVAGNVANHSRIYLDASSGEGGSSLTIGGKLKNYGTLQIGPSDGTLSAPSTVEAGSLAGNGTIDLYGSSTAQATLDVGSAAGFGPAGAVPGEVDLSGDALLEFARGQITTIENALFLTGSHAFIADASNIGSNSALRGLTSLTGSGLLHLANGASVTTSSDLTNAGHLDLDSNSLDDGGSILRVKGALTNSSTILIGNSYLGSLSLSATSTLTAGSVVNDGSIWLSGNEHAGAYAVLHTGGAFTNDGTIVLRNDILSNSDKLGAVSGTGDFSLFHHSTLNFGSSVSSGETVTFDATRDKLILGQPSSFDGTIDDFSTAGDTVVLKGFAESATSLLYTQTGADSCSLTLTDGANNAVLNFGGAPYTQSDFSLVSAQGGAGSAIKFVG